MTGLYVDQLANGRWAICWDDCTRFDSKSYKTAAAAKRALTLLLAPTKG